MLTLYKNDASPPARAVMMVADILGVEYIPHTINPLLREQDTESMTKINPMRTIPYLEDSGFCLADSHAMMIYLFEKYGSKKHSHLYPKDIKVRATINQRLFFDCGILFPRLSFLTMDESTDEYSCIICEKLGSPSSAYSDLGVIQKITKGIATSCFKRTKRWLVTSSSN